MHNFCIYLQILTYLFVEKKVSYLASESMQQSSSKLLALLSFYQKERNTWREVLNFILKI